MYRSVSFPFLKGPDALLLLFCALIGHTAHAQCDQNYDWAVWDGFTGNSSTGTVTTDGGTISVTMSANYGFTSSGGIFGYGYFSGFNGGPPDTTVPQTTWSVGPNGETTMCFSETVSNPVLLIASLGNGTEIVTLEFSTVYNVLFDGGGMTYPDNTTIIGQEGYTILVFPGELDCVTIYSSTPEIYTNITWGLNPPLFEVIVDEVSSTCGSVTYTASGGSTYAWSGGTDPDQATNTFNTSGTYVLTVTDDLGCNVVTSVPVDVPPGTTTTSTTVAAACGSFAWNGDTFTQSGTYTFVSLNAEGCDSVATLELTINESVSTSMSQSACGSFEWNGDLYTESGTYTLGTTTSAGCDSTATLQLTILSGSSATIDVTACDGYTATDGTLLTESGIHEALLVAANGCDSLLTIVLTLDFSERTYEPRLTCDPSDTDTITFTYVNLSGCDSLHSIVPVHYPDSLRAQASFTTDPAQVEIPDGTMETHNTSTNADGFLWDFGDGSPAIDDSAASHTYSEPGIYFITLVAINDLGCRDTATVQMLVYQDPLVFVPDCFTPNGDGLNESFQAVFNGPRLLRDMELRIFNRWGEELLTISDPERAWNGTYNGEPAQDGIYPWRLRFRTTGDSRAREVRGHVSLLR